MLYLKKTVKNNLKLCRKSKFSEPDLEVFQNSRTHYKKLILDQKTTFYLEKAKILSNTNNSAEFWKIIRSVNFKAFHSNTIDTNQWYDFLSAIFPPREAILPDFFGTFDPYLDGDVTQLEIEPSLKKCKMNKAAGVDGLLFECFKNLPSNWLFYLENLFTKFCTLNPPHQTGNDF